MSILSSPVSLSPQEVVSVPTEPIFRLSVAQYHQMIDAGILTEDDPVEFLNGWLVQKMTKNPPHSVSTGLTRTVLERFIPVGWFVDVQEPVTTETSEPEPDVTVVRGERRQYTERHPRPDDVGLLVEVADSTLARDRGTKKQLYARNRISIYWIVNLIDNQIEVYTDPTGPAETPDYQQRHVYGVLDEIPLVLDGQELGRFPVRDLLP
jgi:Uma2 family endonuclease